MDTACEVGFSHGQPILACVTFRSLLHWKSFELERTPLFDRVMQTMSANVEAHTDNNNQLTYWLANTFALLHLVSFPINHIPQTDCPYNTDISFYNLSCSAR